MTMPMPKTNELIREINDYVGTDKVADEFTFARWRRDAMQMTNIPALRAEGYLCLGLLATLKFDVQGIHENFGRALMERPTLMMYSNYFTSLDNCFQPEEAYKQASATNIECIDFWRLKFAVRTCRFQEAVQIQRNGQTHLPPEIGRYFNYKLTTDDYAIANLMERLNIEDSQLTALSASVFRVLHEAGHQEIGSILLNLGDDGFLIKHFIVADVDEVVRLNMCLVDELAEMYTSDLMDCISFVISTRPEGWVQ